MKILVDSNKGQELGVVTAEVVTVNSKELVVLYNDEDSKTELQAEWLYHVYVDKKIDLVVVEDSRVGNVLVGLNVPTVSLL